MILPWVVLLLAPDCGSPGYESGRAIGEIRLGEIVWASYPDAMRPGHPPRALELAPDGSAFLYLQGPPLERVMLQPLPSAGSVSRRAAPIMLGRVRPFGSRGPLFSPNGAQVYFTAHADSDSREGTSAPPHAPVSTRVVRVDIASRNAASIYPPGSGGSGTCVVLFDVHRSGRRLLVGTGRNVSARDAVRGEILLDVQELLLADGGDGQRGPEVTGIRERRPLGFRVSLRGWIRYGRDGEQVECIPAGADETLGSPEVHVFDKETGALLPAGSRRFAAVERAGDLDTRSYLIPHAGSFGWDGFLTHVAGAREAERGDFRRVEFSGEFLELFSTPLVPVSFRGRRVLLAAGPGDRPLPLVATFELSEQGVGSFLQDGGTDRDSSASRALLFDPRFLEGAILARRDIHQEPLLLEVLRSLRIPGGVGAGRREGAALLAVFEERRPDAIAGSRTRVKVTEQVPGCLRVERIPEASAAGTTAEGASGPDRQVVISDGRRCWMMVPGERFVEMAPQAFVRHVNIYSPFRILLDPARLGDPRLRFGEAGSPAASADGRALTSLSFRYVDGFRGELLLERREGHLLPHAIRTPLLFETEALRKAVGLAPRWKTVSYSQWRPVGAHLVPHVVRFDDGLSSRQLELQELTWESNVGEDSFVPPGEVRQ